jgi:REP element-mobilizing transposase RayT
MVTHLVFSTKHREPFIRTDCRDRTFGYLAGTLDALDCPVVLVGGMPDHVHLLFGLSRTLAMSRVVEVKKSSSKWAKEHVHPGFYWQGGYGAFAVSWKDVGEVKAYIANQEEHHRTQSFQDEHRQAMRENGMVWDERYVWD